ncbi:hypothetical protein Tdes44962_MAKER09425 [Teratosphaeria destructans]|uniref:Uncharacterized protein n=1 Tax=Teratosphaeria destructans TaxID=418781 RepID=A0A9W7STC2_9PEZI|nr:hypothetical protein Tdes44962_MAKER09425 [Teratosphaeria destructans]
MAAAKTYDEHVSGAEVPSDLPVLKSTPAPFPDLSPQTASSPDQLNRLDTPADPSSVSVVQPSSAPGSSIPNYTAQTFSPSHGLYHDHGFNFPEYTAETFSQPSGLDLALLPTGPADQPLLWSDNQSVTAAHSFTGWPASWSTGQDHEAAWHAADDHNRATATATDVPESGWTTADPIFGLTNDFSAGYESEWYAFDAGNAESGPGFSLPHTPSADGHVAVGANPSAFIGTTNTTFSPAASADDPCAYDPLTSASSLLEANHIPETSRFDSTPWSSSKPSPLFLTAITTTPPAHRQHAEDRAKARRRAHGTRARKNQLQRLTSRAIAAGVASVQDVKRMEIKAGKEKKRQGWVSMVIAGLRDLLGDARIEDED